MLQLCCCYVSIHLVCHGKYPVILTPGHFQSCNRTLLISSSYKSSTANRNRQSDASHHVLPIQSVTCDSTMLVITGLSSKPLYYWNLLTYAEILPCLCTTKRTDRIVLMYNCVISIDRPAVCYLLHIRTLCTPTSTMGHTCKSTVMITATGVGFNILIQCFCFQN